MKPLRKMSDSDLLSFRIVDDDGKERKVHVIERLANEPPKTE
jgi:hypothetical protein